MHKQRRTVSVFRLSLRKGSQPLALKFRPIPGGAAVTSPPGAGTGLRILIRSSPVIRSQQRRAGFNALFRVSPASALGHRPRSCDNLFRIAYRKRRAASLYDAIHQSV
jgi:hypothetical protein